MFFIFFNVISFFHFGSRFSNCTLKIFHVKHDVICRCTFLDLMLLSFYTLALQFENYDFNFFEIHNFLKSIIIINSQMMTKGQKSHPLQSLILYKTYMFMASCLRLQLTKIVIKVLILILLFLFLLCLLRLLKLRGSLDCQAEFLVYFLYDVDSRAILICNTQHSLVERGNRLFVSLPLCLLFRHNLAFLLLLSWPLLLLLSQQSYLFWPCVESTLLQLRQLGQLLAFLKQKVDMQGVVRIELREVGGIDILLLHPAEALVDEVGVELDSDGVVCLSPNMVLHQQQKFVSQYDILFLQSGTQYVSFDYLPTISTLEDCYLSAPELDADPRLGVIPATSLQSGWVVNDDLEQLELELVDAVKIVEVVHEVPKQHVQVLVHLPLRLVQPHSQRSVYKENGLAYVLGPHQPVPVDIAGEEESAADAAILAVQVDAGLPALREAVDGVEGEHQLVEGHVGVHGEAEVVHLSLLRHLQQLLLNSRLVPVLAHVPNLKLALADVRPQLPNVVRLWELDMVDLRQDLGDLVLTQNLVLELGVVVGNVVSEALHCFAILELVQHANERSEHPRFYTSYDQSISSQYSSSHSKAI